LRQRDQVSEPAERTPIAENDLRVRGHDVRPLPRNGPKSVLVDLQQEPPAGSVASLAYADELLSAEGMERVRDPHKVRKKLEKDRFPWPRDHGTEVVELSGRELNWLLDGMDVFAMKPHGELSYETVL
jgi:hypothetical protein